MGSRWSRTYEEVRVLESDEQEEEVSHQSTVLLKDARDFSYEQCPAYERLLDGWLREAEYHERTCKGCLRCHLGHLPWEIVEERDRLLHEVIQRHEDGLCGHRVCRKSAGSPWVPVETRGVPVAR